MINYKIEQLDKTCLNWDYIRNFLLNQIKNEYDLEYTPQYHKDIKYLKEFYINPKRNNFYIAVNLRNNNILGTIGIREYDYICNHFPNTYSKENTASFYRVFVDKKYRRNGIASNLVNVAENFCYNNGFKEIYLHTQKFVKGALSFWINQDFKIKFDSNNKLKTVHMDKMIADF